MSRMAGGKLAAFELWKVWKVWLHVGDDRAVAAQDRGQYEEYDAVIEGCMMSRLR